MGKLRVYADFYEDFKTAHVSVPTTKLYEEKGVYDNIADIAERFNYISISGASKKPQNFIGTSLNVLIITFRNLADLKKFKELVTQSYEA